MNKKKFLTREDYLEFLDNAIFSTNEKENHKFLNTTVRDFCRHQVEEYENGRLYGEGLNFVAYLMSKYHGTMMTYKTQGYLCCAFVYPKVIEYQTPLYDKNNKIIYENGKPVMRKSFRTELFVCDPELALIGGIKGDEEFFDIPLSEFYTVNMSESGLLPQEYAIYTSMNCENRKKSILDYVNTPQNRWTYTFDDLSGLKSHLDDMSQLDKKGWDYINIKGKINEVSHVFDEVVKQDREVYKETMANRA